MLPRATGACTEAGRDQTRLWPPAPSNPATGKPTRISRSRQTLPPVHRVGSGGLFQAHILRYRMPPEGISPSQIRPRCGPASISRFTWPIFTLRNGEVTAFSPVGDSRSVCNLRSSPMIILRARARKVKIFSRPTSLYCATSCNRHGKQKSALVEPQCFPPLRLST